jgi:hypothetical protein
MRRFNHVLRSFALASATLIFSGCNTVMIGDSIFNMSRDDLDGTVDASDGRGAYNAGLNGDPLTGDEAVSALATTVVVKAWLVVGLGTNDARTEPSTAGFATFVRTTVDRLPDDRCLAWVIPYNPQFPEASRTIEAAIRDNISAQPCHALVDWGATAQAHPELTVDGIHPTPAGRKVLSDMIKAVTG